MYIHISYTGLQINYYSSPIIVLLFIAYVHIRPELSERFKKIKEFKIVAK